MSRTRITRCADEKAGARQFLMKAVVETAKGSGQRGHIHGLARRSNTWGLF